MKKVLYLVMVSVLLGNAFSVSAMEEQQAYPWYKSYKSPQLRQKVSEGWQTTQRVAKRGWQTTRDFIKAHKIELALVAAAVGVYLTDRAYNQIFEAYGQSGISLPQIKKENNKEYRELLKIGFIAYAYRMREYGSKAKFIEVTVPKNYSFIYEKYTPNIDHALWKIVKG